MEQAREGKSRQRPQKGRSPTEKQQDLWDAIELKSLLTKNIKQTEQAQKTRERIDIKKNSKTARQLAKMLLTASKQK